jgi:biopolymer transport protein ExbB
MCRDDLDCARRAAERAAAVARHRLARGVGNLQAIGYIAPLLGMFGTVVPLMNFYSVPPCPQCDTAGGLGEIFVPLVLGLPVAMFASGVYHLLRRQLETLDLEMRTATLDLLNRLS